MITKFTKLSITRRLVLMFILVSSTLFASTSVWLYYQLKSSLIKQIQDEQIFRHSVLDPLLIASSNEQEWRQIKEEINALNNRDNRTKYWVLSNSPQYTFSAGNVPASWLDQSDGFAVVPNASNNLFWVIFTRTIAANGERPELRFVTTSDCTPFFNTLAQFRHVLITTCLIGIVLITLLAYFITRLGLAPLRQLSAQANSLPPGNSKKRLDTTSLPCELNELAISFNGALDRQETAWQQLDSFNANVAHELRTPLTNMMGHTQVMLAQQRDVAELENLLESNLEELERLTGIVNDMLFLSYAESGQKAADLSKVDLHEESNKTIEYLEPILSERDVQTAVHGTVHATIDRRLFHRALANLIQNSARYATAGSTIAINLTQEGSCAHIAVTNAGQHIPPEVASQLFERFYRADKARAQSDCHHGLGLSIVRAVAAMHGGTVFVKSRNGLNTFGFTMELTPSA